MIDIVKIAKEIDNLFEMCKERPGNSIEELLDDIDNCVQWVARTGELCAITQEHYDFRQGEESERVIVNYPSASPSIQKKLIDSRTSTEKRLKVQSERLNAALVHRIDALRTKISYMKEDRRVSSFQKSSR